MRRARIRFRFLSWLLLVAGAATAQGSVESPPERGLVYRNLTVARANPTGLIHEGRLSYRHRLYAHDSAALRDNYVSIGVVPSVSPAFARAGVLVEIQPLSVFQVWALYEGVGFFGTFNQLQSFTSVGADYGDRALQERAALPEGDPARPRSSSGTQLTVGTTLQAAVGPLAARNQFRLIRPNHSLRQGDVLLYDAVYDVLAPNRGWFLANDADLLYQTAFGLTAGIRWTATHPFYTSAHGVPHGATTGTTHRIGPLVAYTFWNEVGARFNTPTVLLIANWWITHRYRTGQEVSQGVPYLALGFAFTGDLLARR